MLDSNGRSNDLRKRIDADLCSLKACAQFRSLETSLGTNLCSNDYLGLASDPRLKQAIVAAVERTSRCGSTGSRLLSGDSYEWENLEREFADFVRAETALYFGSGYAANVGLLSAILQPNDIAFSDALNHASLIDGLRLSRAQKIIYLHNDLYGLEQALEKNVDSSGARLIVTESIFSMEGDIAPLGNILQLAEKYDAYVVVDDAHALGVFGEQGRGIAAELPKRERILAVVYPCGKALASIGAFVCGSGALKDFLVNHARSFIFSTATPPYIAHQISAALKFAREANGRRSHLQQIAASLRFNLSAAGINCGASTSQIIPVIVGSNEESLRLASHLQSAGFAVKAIRPPTIPPGTSRIRLSLTSEISFSEVQRLTGTLIAAMTGPQRPAPSATVAHV